MSPNQPKTPITSFRLDDETKERLRRQADSIGATMTEAVKRAVDAMDNLNKAMRAADPEMAAHLDAVDAARGKGSRKAEADRRAVSALADFLVLRDWPNSTPREMSNKRSNTYSAMAAAILNGEAWAIRKAWPEAATEIAHSRPA